MPLTSAQIITRACTIAKAPGYKVQAGVYLNMVLSSLCQEYSFDYIKKTQTISFTNAPGYAMNSDHLRTKEVFYNVNGNPFYLFQIPIETYHTLFNGPGVSNYPNKFAVDVSTTPHTILFYPPPSISQTVTVNYYPQKDDIVTPETSTAVPWFTNQEYLIRKLAACLMLETDDDRQTSFDLQAADLLEKILSMKDDKEGFSDTIKLSRERFRTGQTSNPNKAFPLS
jgi:hypothetical protein